MYQLMMDHPLRNQFLAFSPFLIWSQFWQSRERLQNVSVSLIFAIWSQRRIFYGANGKGGGKLYITVNWSIPLNDVEMLHRKWLTSADGRMEKYHPKYRGFENALKSLRERISDGVESTTHIVLTFTVETHIKSRTALGWHESTRVIYI